MAFRSSRASTKGEMQMNEGFCFLCKEYRYNLHKFAALRESVGVTVSICESCLQKGLSKKTK